MFSRTASGLGILLTAALLLGCESGPASEETEVEHNVLKEYVNTPKQKARDVADRLEASQQKVHEQFKQLDE